MEEKIKRLIYLAESFVPWKPNKLAVLPWEIGLRPSQETIKVVERTTTAILKGIYDNTNDTR